MIQIFTLNKEVGTKAEVVDEGEAEVDTREEVVDEGATAVEVEGDSVGVVEEATIRIELHEKHRCCKRIHVNH